MAPRAVVLAVKKKKNCCNSVEPLEEVCGEVVLLRNTFLFFSQRIVKTPATTTVYATFPPNTDARKLESCLFELRERRSGGCIR